MKRLRILVLVAIICGTALAAQAQNDLFISKVFDTYGKQKGVVMVELTREVLKEYHFTKFRSITIKDDPDAAEFARKCLARDEDGARKIKQVVANGVPTSIFLELPPMGQVNRLILYTQNTRDEFTVTLIYIQTKEPIEHALKLLLRKKQ